MRKNKPFHPVFSIADINVTPVQVEGSQPAQEKQATLQKYLFAIKAAA
jgi:hypothetical protein